MFPAQYFPNSTTSSDVIPDPSDVREDTPVGQTVGTLAVPRVGRVIAGVAVDDTIGTYTQVAAGNVAEGIQWGEDGTEYTGTLQTGDTGIVPAATDVRAGVATGVTVGVLVLPSVGDVRTSVGYGANGAEFVGEWDGDCPPPGDVGWVG